MSKIEPRTLSGFMELMPNEQVLFNYVKEQITSTYEQYGFYPLDTPVIEDGAVLLAKAGGETEKQIYRAYHNNPVDENLVLRFDLTVPLAKYVAKNYNSLSFPFRRYQVGKVYRGERPQKGRFREFYQCDIDIIGDGALSIINDAEIPSIIYSIFKKLGFHAFKIQINNRKILSGLLFGLNIEESRHSDVLHILDKIKKIGPEKTKDELLSFIDSKAVNLILNLVSSQESTDNKIAYLKSLSVDNELYNLGTTEIEEVVRCIRLFGVPDEYFEIDFSIVRGLDYYTGTVYETFITGHEEIGSVCSGGRYENLAGYYTDKKLPGVGISIGLTRLFDKLKDIFETKKNTVDDVLIVSADSCYESCLTIAASARSVGLNAEVYVEDARLKSKLKRASKLGIPFVIIIGEDERKSAKVILKDMFKNEQYTLELQSALEKIKNNKKI